jgi:mRNA interferase MazF
MAKGDIVLIPFPFTDLTGSKLRPAVILVDASLDLTVCFITTQIKWAEPTDIGLQPLAANGIKKPSLIRISKIATIDRKLAVGKIGALDKIQLNELDSKLKILLQLT